MEKVGGRGEWWWEAEWSGKKRVWGYKHRGVDEVVKYEESDQGQGIWLCSITTSILNLLC